MAKIKVLLLSLVLAVACVAVLASCGPDEPECEHKFKQIPAQAATCIATGMDPYEKCEKCGYVPLDNGYANEAAYIIPIDPDAHNWYGMKCLLCDEDRPFTTVGITYELNADGQSYAVISTLGVLEEDVIVPPEYEGKPVTRIAKEAFSNRSISHVVLPKSITTIDSEITYDNSGNFKSSLSAFTRCSGLVSFYLPKDSAVTELAPALFSGCEMLEKVTIPTGIQKIGERAFFECEALKEIVFDKGTAETVVGDVAGTVNLPKGLASIGKNAFSSCIAMTKIVIEKGSLLTLIDSDAFSGCSALTEILFENGSSLLTISRRAFADCTSLETLALTIPADGKIAKQVSIPKSVTAIHDDVFKNCVKITSIVIPADAALAEIKLGAFFGCAALSSITLPYIGTSKDAATLNHFGYIFGATTAYDNRANVPALLKTVTVSGGTRIEDNAFLGCSGIEVLTLPKTVVSIGDTAFRDCEGLVTLTLPSDSALTTIGAFAFYNTAITTVSLPKTVTSLNTSFVGCKNLTEIKIADGNTAYAFKGNALIDLASKSIVHGLNGCVIPTDGSVTSIEIAAFYESDITSLVIPDKVTAIGDWAFFGCDKLTTVKINKSVTYIGSNAFHNCDSLVEIEFEGTKAEWNNVQKGSDWNMLTGAYTVVCTDGEINK